MGSRDSKQYATRHNSASEASLLLKFCQEFSYEILVMLMPLDLVCAFPVRQELFIILDKCKALWGKPEQPSINAMILKLQMAW